MCDLTEVMDALVESTLEAFERRKAKEALAAWRAGYRYLEVVRPLEQNPVYDGLEAFDVGIQAAFVPRRTRPTDHRDGTTTECVELRPLDDRQKRRQLKAALKNDTNPL